MPETIVPEAQEIRATATALLKQPRTSRQAACSLPKHFPSAQTEALLYAVVEFTRLAERQAAELEDYKRLEIARDAAFIAELEEWEASEDGRQYMEACAAEHRFYPGILAG